MSFVVHTVLYHKCTGDTLTIGKLVCIVYLGRKVYAVQCTVIYEASILQRGGKLCVYIFLSNTGELLKMGK